MTGRGSMYGQNQRTGANLYGHSGYANETLHAMPSSSQPPPEARGRSYGGGQSSFNPFAHEGQGRYNNPYEQPPPPTSQTMQINQGSGFHSMGQGHHRRRAENFEVVSTSYQPPAAESGYGSYAQSEPQAYGYDPSYGQTSPGEYQSSYGAPPAYSQGSDGYNYPAYAEAVKYQ
ncbi:hypothetical protein SPRG_09272 [Saprolegnia parasitica CBS 223.65]|uniref:Uncharacterized protein n=1 Tax=Saprolegnia parasitica (strain CBS 223.65) TaxID=695850 RepID=A0A067C2X9_SAPPC|nr:hypothetical protein SPRG_09272 [Saprolegnia parasitica CBS 223.65]KDO25124.1 hypothetical protein SPRG_09272 [Saprolegnia parasitica CBS 223.65]|eukprot:XP_012204193.1 hypothetical protein SPRG_09272 [Saprolegnia parasitica CBS 223.65]